jgi:predicted esterase
MTIHDAQPVYTAGKPLNEAKAAMILVHGRGASAADIMTLANELYHEDIAYFAPEAANSTWYPNSFLNPIRSNEPGISSGIAKIASIVAQIQDEGIPTHKIIIGGFSQGACLSSEFVARNPAKYGAVFAFSGGVIGPPGTPRDYPGDLENTPIFLGCSDVDFHIPKERVQESADVFRKMGANVTEKLYPNLGHTINMDEIQIAKTILQGVLDA